MERESMDNERLLHKYLNGTATTEEIERLRQDPVYASYLKIADVSSEMATPQFDAERNFQMIGQQLDSHGGSKVRKLSPRRMFLRIAAAVVLLLAGYYFIRESETTIRTEIAQKKEITLPDASEVFMNAQSELTYNKNTWKNERSLELRGEAYFKVSKGEKFSVETPLGMVQVLGTEFNVYSRGDRFELRCFEGLVSVTAQGKTKEVPAGSSVMITSGNNWIERATTQLVPSWIVNESTFENVSLSLVLEELERQYPVTINSKEIINKKFTGSFTHEDLEVALRSICDPLEASFTIEGEEVTLYANTNN